MAIAPPNFTTGLLGYDPRQNRLDQQKLWATLYGQQQSPYGQIGVGLGQLLGAGIGMLTGKNEEQVKEETLTNLQTDANSKFAFGTPEYFNYILEKLPPQYTEARAYVSNALREESIKNQENFGKQASLANSNPELVGMVSTPQSADLGRMVNQMTAANQGQPLTEAQIGSLQTSRPFQQAVGLVSTAEAGMQKREGSPDTAADKVIYENLVKESKDPLDAALKFKEYKAKLTQKGNTPLTAGNVKPSDVATFVTNVETTLKPAKAKLDAYNELRGFLEQARQNNPEANSQIQRWLVKMSGDNQIGSGEIKLIANAGGIAERTVGGVQSFVSGTLTKDKIDNIEKILDSSEKQTATQFNKAREKLVGTWGTSNLPAQTLKSQLGDPWITAAEKRKLKEKKSKTVGVTLSPAATSLINKYLPEKR
jgi:hypothetical protein